MKDEAEQAEFERWLDRVKPSGCVDSVHGQWLDSYDRADLIEKQERSKESCRKAFEDWRSKNCRSLSDTAYPVWEAAWKITQGVHVDTCDGCGSDNLILKCCDCDNETYPNR